MGKRGVVPRDGAENLVMLTAKIPNDVMLYIRKYYPDGVSIGVRALLAAGIEHLEHCQFSDSSMPAARPQPKNSAPRRMQTVSKTPAQNPTLFGQEIVPANVIYKPAARRNEAEEDDRPWEELTPAERLARKFGKPKQREVKRIDGTDVLDD